MKKIISFCFFVFLTGFFAGPLWAYPESVPSNTSTPILSTGYLKQFMAKFGTLVAGLEIMRAKDEKPDWKAIEWTVNEMKKNWKETQKATSSVEAYQGYLQVLSLHIEALDKKTKKKDKGIYDAVDAMTESCFQCHTAHRPADFLVPKNNQKISNRFIESK